jgi:hypothetical protein
MAGAIQWFLNSNWQVDHWTFTDSSGAEYRLDNDISSGVWATSTDSATFVFDPNANKLYFPSGTSWYFGSCSTGNEGDESPTSSISKTGAVTNFSYVNSPPQVLSRTNPNGNSVGRVARMTLDGFGRTVKAEAGTGTYSNGTVSLTNVVSFTATTATSA